MFISEDPANDGVNWHDWDAEAYAADYSMHKILCDLADIWNNGNESQKQYAADLANTIRESYSQRYEYNDIDGNALENTGGTYSYWDDSEDTSLICIALILREGY